MEHGERKPSLVGKVIIGVPVLPMPGPRVSTSSLDDPAPSHIQDVLEPDGLTDPAHTTWKLHHMDFLPQPVKGKKEDDYETFQFVVDRANTWIRDSPAALVFTCETLTWSAIDKALYTDSGLMQKSMHADKKTRLYRGIRVWYVVLEDTFYDKASMPSSPFITYMDYVPGKNEETSHLIKKINEDIGRKKFRGKLMKVETLHVLSELGDPAACVWKEQPEISKDYTTILRVYTLSKPADGPAVIKNLGFHDFVPTYDQRSVHNQGYEVYSDLWRRAARWLYTNPKHRCVNIHSVFVKAKKGDDSSTCLWERLGHKEHGSAHGSLRGDTKTDYFQLLRLVYCEAEEPSPKMMFYKTFSPLRLQRPGVPDDPELMEASHEDLRTMEDKLNIWLAYSGAKVFGVETVPARLTTGGQETLGPEATFVCNGKERNVAREYWKNHIRLYIEGEFRQASMSWHQRLVEQSPVGATTHT